MRFILESGKIVKDNILNNEGKFTIGNGKIHIRGSFEEGLTVAPQDEEYMRMPANVTIEKKRNIISKVGTFCPAVTGNHPLLNNQMVNLPNIIATEIYYQDTKLDMLDSKIKKYKQTLNYKTGEFTRKFEWHIDNKILAFTFTRFAYLGKTQEIYQQVKIIGDVKDVKVIHKIDHHVKTNGYNHFVNIDFSESEIRNLKCHGITDAKDKFYIHKEISTTGIVKENSQLENLNGENYNCEIKTSINFNKFNQPNEMSYAEALEENTKILKKDFENALIDIDGNDELQEALDFSVYHLNRAQNRYSNKYAICAKGFAGEAYYGHYFWDTEIYLFPFFLYTNPKRAKKLLEFRINTLKGAMKNAKRYGYSGAKYPWESSKNGEEQCSNWQYADFEVHVNADICYAFSKYYQITNDVQFLEKSIDVFHEVSNYWIERTYEKNGEIHLNGVMGPDEYLFFTNNNYFTNYMIKSTLGDYLKYLDILNIKIDSKKYEQVKKIVDNIILPEKDGILLQCSNFLDFEDLDLDNIWKNKDDYFGRHISQERNYRSKMLKQADVLLLFVLFENDFISNYSLESNLDYYDKITSHDSSLSMVIHAILRAKLGDYSEFNNAIKQAYEPDFLGKGCEDGIHIANQAGIWLAILYGLLNVDLDDKESKPRGALPSNISRVEMNITKQNKKIKLVKEQNV